LLVRAGWSGVHPRAKEAKGVLRVARFDDVDSVDPALAYSGSSWSCPRLARPVGGVEQPCARGVQRRLCYFVHPVYRDDLAAICKK